MEDKIPIMGFIDLVGVSDDDICDVKYKLKNVSAKPNMVEEHSVAVEIEVEMLCRVFGSREVNAIQDMYSPSRNLKLNQKSVNTMVNMKNTVNTINIREKVRLEETDYNKICDVMVEPVINEVNIVTDIAKYAGDINLRFILSNNDGTEFKAQNASIPFNFNQEIEGIEKESKIDIELTKIFAEFTKDNMEVSAKIDLEARTNSYSVENIGVIDNIEELENSNDNPYSMVIYFVKPGDTIWKIAKRYKSTIEDIARINNIENPDKITPGMQLFIPRCSICSRSNINVNA